MLYSRSHSHPRSHSNLILPCKRCSPRRAIGAIGPCVQNWSFTLHTGRLSVSVEIEIGERSNAIDYEECYEDSNIHYLVKKVLVALNATFNNVAFDLYISQFMLDLIPCSMFNTRNLTLERDQLLTFPRSRFHDVTMSI